MTTENHPAEGSAATDETEHTTPQESPPADAVAAQPSAAKEPEHSESSEASGATDAQRPDTPPAAEDDQESPSQPTAATEQMPPEQIIPAADDAAATSSAPATPPPASGPIQRRVRLNPTVSPDIAKPIPTLKSTTPPPTPVADEKTSAAPESQADDTTSSSDQSASSASSGESAPVPQSYADEASAPPPPKADPVELPSRRKQESLDADLEAELEAAMAGEQQQAEAVVEEVASADEATEAALTPDADVKRGTKLKGTVASIHGDDMFIDFGLRMAGVLSRRQFGLRKQPMQGETVEAVVSRIDENEGLIHVNLPTGTSRVRGEWDAIVVDQNVECMVTGTNKGGLEVSIGALRGFMPASQVDLGFVPDLAVYVGQKLTARVAEVNPKRRKLVLSRRALLEEEREHSQEELFEKIQPGQQYTGRVRTLKDYGAFVDIGGADGLLHVAQISWSRINHPSEVLQEGEEIEVQVLSVDRDKKKISLGMRQLTQNPWKAAESKFTQGTTVKGKVTRIENFGAFVELEEGVEGLVHISELDHKRVNRVGDVLRVDQEVDVQVLEVDPKRKRISLSLKALKEKPEDPVEKAESEPIKRQRSVDTLVGGMGDPTGGQLFGDPSKFKK